MIMALAVDDCVNTGYCYHERRKRFRRPLPMRNNLALFMAACLLSACAGVEVDTWEPERFAAGQYRTYSWRSEPFSDGFFTTDPIYVIDPILREVVDDALVGKGYRRVSRDGDFTIDYIYAPGIRLGAPTEATSFISPRAGVRPNANISQAERDNAIALSGVKETRNIALQINDQGSGKEVFRAVITKIVANANKPEKSRTRSILKSGVNRAFRELPDAD
jgi:hypothetical protein